MKPTRNRSETSSDQRSSANPLPAGPLARELAARIDGDMATFSEFPSIAELGKLYRASAPTISAALHVLADSGKISVVAGRRARRILPVSRPPTAKVSESSETRLYNQLKTKILDGEFRIGDPLPKLAFHAIANHLSTHTVCKVYRRLAEEGLAWRRGKTMLTGPDPNVARHAGLRHCGVMLILSDKPSTWVNVCRSVRTEQFGGAFVKEAQRSGIRLVLACTGQQSARYDFAPAGRENVLQYIRDLEGRYMGTLIVGKKFRFENLEKWIRDLLLYSRRVLWFDEANEGPLAGVRSPSFIRCHTDERRAAALCIEYLHKQGHRKAAYLHALSIEWQARRLGDLQTAAHSPPHQVAVTGYPVLPATPSSVHFLTKLAGKDSSHFGRALKKLVAAESRLKGIYAEYCHPELDNFPFTGIAGCEAANLAHSGNIDNTDLALLRIFWALKAIAPAIEKGCTVLIAPNDEYAGSLVRKWVIDLEMVVPRDVSIIAFDNAFRGSYYPLTSLDFGFDHLGYHAFHALLDDLPYARSRGGDLAAKPAVVDNGSVLDSEPGA